MSSFTHTLRLIRSRAVAAAIATLAVFVALSFSYFAFTFISADAQEGPPDSVNITNGTWKSGSGVVTLIFNVPVTNGVQSENPDDLMLDASDFVITGTDGVGITSVVHDPWDTTVFILLDGALDIGGPGEFLIGCASNAIKHIGAEAFCATGQQDMDEIPQDTDGPEVAIFNQTDETRLFLGFNEALHPDTAIADNLTLSTANGGDDSTITNIDTYGNGIEIEADGAVFAMGDTVTISTNITDLHGNAQAGDVVPLSPTLVISEVSISDGGSTKNEFIELYNYGQEDIVLDADGLDLKLHFYDESNTTDYNLPLTFFSDTIWPGGFFLIAPSGFYDEEVDHGNLDRDAGYSTSTTNVGSSGAVYISLSETADTSVLDAVGWNDSAINEGEALTHGLDWGESYERKANAFADAHMMAEDGGFDRDGNAADTGNNKNDFVKQETRVPQGTMSQIEYPNGFAGDHEGDGDGPEVDGSFPSEDDAEWIAPDIKFASIKFSELVDGDTVSTDSVFLIDEAIGEETNLCETVEYEPGFIADVICEIDPDYLPLNTNSVHHFVVTEDVEDVNGNPLVEEFDLEFTPCDSCSFSDTSPPDVVGSYPGDGVYDFPPNGGGVIVDFNKSMDTSSFSGVEILDNFGVPITLDGIDFLSTVVEDDGIAIGLAENLDVNTGYSVHIPVSVTSSDGVPLPEDVWIHFSTAGENDTSAPSIIASSYRDGDTGVPVGTQVFTFVFDDAMDDSLFEDGVHVTQGGDVVTTTKTYYSSTKELQVVFRNGLEPNTEYTVQFAATTNQSVLRNNAGYALLDDQDGEGGDEMHMSSFTTGNADTDAPYPLFAMSTESTLIIQFNEPMKGSDVINLENWTLHSGSPGSLEEIPLNGGSGIDVNWDAQNYEVEITVPGLKPGDEFSIEPAGNMKDAAGNAIGQSVVLYGMVEEGSSCDYCGSASDGYGGDFYGEVEGFGSDDGYGYVPQASVWPMNSTAGETTALFVDMPISQQIPSTGWVEFQFPDGFDVSNASIPNNYTNEDVNGSGEGMIGIQSISVDKVARLIKIKFDTHTRCDNGNVLDCGGDESDFIALDIDNIILPSTPRGFGTQGYSVDIRTKGGANGTTLLDRYTTPGFPVDESGDGAVTIDLTATGMSSGTAEVEMFCSASGVRQAEADWADEGDGTAQVTFSGLQNGEFCDLRTQEMSLNLGGSEGNFRGVNFVPINVDGTYTKEITLQATLGLTSVSVVITAPAGKNIDVFAYPDGGFSSGEPDMKTITTGAGDDTVTLKIGDGRYFIGIGPEMPKDAGMWQMPEPPDYSITPSEVHIRVDGASIFEDADIENDGILPFTLSTISDVATIAVKDTSGNPMVDATVFVDGARGGFYTSGVTGIDGTVTVSVPKGKFRTGAWLQGAPPTQETRFFVDGAGLVYQEGSTVATNQVVLKVSKGSQKITGTVSAGGFAISGADVHAFCTANCQGYFDASSRTSADGSYALFVPNGNYQVESWIPGYGPMMSSAAVSGADVKDVNFEVEDGETTYRTISGGVCQEDGGAADCSGGTPLEGIEVFVYGPDGYNHGWTDDGGDYEVRVPDGEGYTIDFYDPSSGPLGILTNIDPDGVNITSADFAIDSPEGVTVSIKDSGSNAVAVSEMFIEFVDDSSNIEQAMFISANDQGSINLPEGDYDIYIHSPGLNLDPTDDISGDGVSGGKLTVDGSESIIVEVDNLRTVSGTILDDSSNPVVDALVELKDVANGTSVAVFTDTSGNYSASLPDGNYQAIVNSPGVTVGARSVTVSGGNEDIDFSGTETDRAITGNITDPNGNAVAYATVVAEQEGGGVMMVQADASGDYSIPVADNEIYSISAIGHGYEAEALSDDVEIDGTDSTSNDIAFDTSVSITAPTVQALTPSKGGVVSDSTIGTTVTVPANALSSSANAGSITVKETNNAFNTASTTVVGGTFEVNATDAGGTALTSDFSSKVTLKQEMTVADLAAAGSDTLAEVEGHSMSYFSTASGTWVDEATTTIFLDANDNIVTSPSADLSNVTSVSFKAQVSHFTVFSITAPADGLGPSTPTGVAATGTNGGVLVTWSAVTTNSDSSAITDLAGYEVYRDTTSGGSFTTQINSSDISGTSYTDTTAGVGTTYFYKVTAADTGGQESVKSSAASGAATSGGVNIGVTGGGGSMSVPQTTVSVDTPSEGGSVMGGSNYNVTWNVSGNATDVDVYVSYDAGSTFNLIASAQNANQGYLWTIPNVNAEVSMIRVDVRNGGEVLSSSTSATFAITVDQAKDVVTVDSVSSPDPVSELVPSKDDAEASLPDDLDAGFLVKAPGLPAVYFLGGDGKRHSFPNESVYFSWFQDFSQVQEISVSKMASIGLGEPVRVRPGTWMIKIQSDAKTYAVEPGGTIRWVQTETVATDLFGADWNKRILDVEPTMFSSYSAGAPLSNSNEHPVGMVVRDAEGFAHYVAEDGNLRRFADEAAVRANMIQTRFERPAVAGDLARSAGVIINNIEDILFRYQDIGR